jgi:photosystem II stability/assembly factor-like uncharacterized protein
MVYRSHDGGDHWQKTNLKTMYAPILTTTSKYVLAQSRGAWRTSDNGTTWENCGLDTVTFRAMFVRGDTVLGSTAYGLYMSTDQGGSWILRPNSNRPARSFQSFGKVGSTIIAIAGDGMYKTTNDGESWDASTPLPLGDLLFPSISTAGDTVFVCSFDGDLFYSTDTANSWQSLNFPRSCKAVVKHDSLLMCSNRQSVLYVSTDFGTTWTKRVAGTTASSDCTLMWVGDTLFVGNGIGVYRSVDHGFGWTPCMQGLENPTVWSMCQDNDVLYVGTMDNGVYHSRDTGGSWDALASSYRFDLGVPCIVSVGDTIFAGTQGRGLVTSGDGGKTWMSTPGIAGGSGEGIRALARGNGMIYASSSRSGDGIYNSSDNGASWVRNTTGLPATVSAVDIAVQGDTVVIADFNGPYASFDKGQHWTAINAGLKDVHATSVCFRDKDVWIAGDTTGLYYSPDFGQTWQTVTPDADNRRMLRVRLSGNTVVAVTDASYIMISLFANRLARSNVFASLDKGRSWKTIGQELSGLNIRSAEVFDGTVYVGQTNRGLYAAKLSDFDLTVDVPQESVSPIPSSNYAFHAALPTRVLGSESPEADLQLFDILGVEKKCWSSSTVQSQQQLDVADLTPGSYCLKRGAMRWIVFLY